MSIVEWIVMLRFLNSLIEVLGINDSITLALIVVCFKKKAEKRKLICFGQTLLLILFYTSIYVEQTKYSQHKLIIPSRFPILAFLWLKK